MNKVICPLSVNISSNNKWILNLNRYRNTYFKALNKAKHEYFKAVISQVSKLRGWHRVALKLTVYPATNRKFDISNVCSIHDKFLLDAVVRAGKLPDDDWRHVVKTTYLFGEVDRARPRVEAEFIDMDI